MKLFIKERDMNMQQTKIAIVADTAIDVPRELVEKYHIFQIPITVIFSDGEYRDTIDITSEEVYQRLDKEIPKTSLPSGEMIQTTFDKIAEEGYTHAVMFTMSSQMSGTYNLIRLMASEETRFESHVFDTRNIGLGGGFFAIEAAEAVQAGKSYDYIVEHICSNVSRSKQFGKFETFDYLQKGGRVGLVTAKIGSLLNIKPIISVNEDGVIYTASKVKGDKRARKEMLRLLDEFLSQHDHCYLSVLDGDDEEEVNVLYDALVQKYPEHTIFKQHIGSALGIHTGPGMVIIGAYALAE